MTKSFLLVIIVSVWLCGLNTAVAYAQRRDPFVPLVDNTGRIRTAVELSKPSSVVVPVKIVLGGIVWSEKRPLAIINKKIFHMGDAIIEGLIVETISPEQVVLDYYGEKMVFPVRKKEKK